MINIDTNVNWMALPEDMLSEIVGFCNNNAQINLRLTCRKLQRLVDQSLTSLHARSEPILYVALHINKFPKVVQLQLRSAKGRDLSALTDKISRLNLSMSRDTLSATACQKMRYPNAVQTLSLVGCKVDLAALCRCQSLVELHLGNARLENFSVEQLQQLGALRILHLTKSTIDAENLTKIARLPLSSLYIGENQNINLSVASACAASTSLTILSMEENTNRIAPLNNDIVYKLSEAISITTLCLDRNPISIEGVVSLAAANTLQFLCLSYCKITDAGARMLAHGKNTLTRLELLGNGITSRGTKALAGKTSLRVLWLSARKIDDDALSVFSATNKLENLWFKSSDIGNRGLKILSKTSSLKSLRISSDNVSSKGIDAFSGHLRLTRLRIDESPIGASGAASMRNLGIRTVFYHLFGSFYDGTFLPQLTIQTASEWIAASKAIDFSSTKYLKLTQTALPASGLTPLPKNLHRLELTGDVDTALHRDFALMLENTDSLQHISFINLTISYAQAKLLSRHPSIKTIFLKNCHLDNDAEQEINAMLIEPITDIIDIFGAGPHIPAI